MASPSQDSPLKTLYRLTVMVGVLGCVSMAAYQYGPEPDDLAGMIDATAERLGVEMPADAAANEPALEPAPLLVAEAASIETPALGDPPRRLDPAVQAASALVPIPRTPAAGIDPIERERLIAPALAAGLTRADVSRWSEGLYRATGSMPVGDPASGLKRRFDAQGTTPELAVAALLRQVQTELYR